MTYNVLNIQLKTKPYCTTPQYFDQLCSKSTSELTSMHASQLIFSSIH